MINDVDVKLDGAFTPERIAQAFFGYKIAKWDRFSGVVNPVINMPMGADGIDVKGFEKQLDRHAVNIANRVHDDTYVFYPFREVDKPKIPDRPPTSDNIRTLGIASIRDALVQGILYSDVLYVPIETLFKTLDNPVPVSFAYRKGKSAPLAAQMVHRHIRDGYRYVLDADLSKFFDTIPHVILLSRVAQVIGGDESRTYRLINRFISTDRVPYRTYRKEKRWGRIIGPKIFHNRKPSRRKTVQGVPQGGILSGMLANLYLHPFDNWVVHDLGVRYDLRYVRYADDFIIMTKTRSELDPIREEVGEILESEDYRLKVNEEKTLLVDVLQDGLDFVGFHFNGSVISVRQKNVDRFKQRVSTEIFDEAPDGLTVDATLRWLIRRINAKIRGWSGKQACPRCGLDRIGPSRSWMAFFNVVTDESQIRLLDKWIRQQVYDFIFRKFNQRLKRKDLSRATGKNRLLSLVGEAHRSRANGIRPCLCDLAERNGEIWSFAKDLYEGKTFLTVAQRRAFTVARVTPVDVQVSVRSRQYRVARETIEAIWTRVMNGEVVTRTTLEQEGIYNSSHVAVLVGEIPGICVKPNPIRLVSVPKRPAPFVGKPNIGGERN